MPSLRVPRRGDIIIPLPLLCHHIEMGRHSGIPACCVLFYVSVWLHIYTREEGRVYWQRMHDVEVKENIDAQYIVCPNCLKRREFINIHRCGGERCEQITAEAARLGLKHSWAFKKPLRLQDVADRIRPSERQRVRTAQLSRSFVKESTRK